MFGSKFFKPIHGEWHHVGYMTTEELPIPTGVTLKKGTWLASKTGDDTKAVLASGYGLGVMTQDMDLEGHTSVQSFYNRSIGMVDLPIKKGAAVSVRVPDSGAECEWEGAGAAVPGNLVCTSGTGAISTATVRKTELSFLNGCIRIAQTGDIVTLLLEDAALTPEVAGNVRIRATKIGGYVK